MESIVTHIGDFLLRQSVHLLVLFALVALVVFTLRHRSAHLRYLLWLLIIAKCLMPPLHTISLAILPSPPTAPVIVEDPPSTPLATAPAEIEWMSPTLPEETFTLPAAVEPAPTVAPITPPQSTLWEKLQTVSIGTWLVITWLSGVAAYWLIMLIKGLRFHHWVRHNRRQLSLRSHLEVFNAMQAARRVRIYELPNAPQPFVWGLIRGAIYLPRGFTLTDDPQKQHAVLMHELGHVLRLDPLVNLLQVLAQGLFWFHPLVWLANARIRAEREKCCDEFAIAKLRTAPQKYCSAIVDVLLAQQTARRPVPTLAVAGPVKNIEDRIKTALTPGRRFTTRPAPRAVLAITLLAALIVPTTIALSSRPGEPVETPKASDIQEDKSYIATLSDGTTVELLAVCEHPSDISPWWRPDGSPYDGEKTNKFDFRDALVPKEDEFVRLLLVHSPYWPENHTFADYEIVGCNGAGFYPQTQKDEDKYSSTQAFITRFKDNVSSTSLTLGFGIGKWEFVAAGTHGRSGAGATDSLFGRGVIYEEAEERHGELFLKAYHRLDKEYECRLVAR
ncbi:MAG: M56 family metallopeptidase, partial [Sedimentisphaerales bacterium]|nr:M56 family metallopeptidase [Sedimentisphaerales bacterium]